MMYQSTNRACYNSYYVPFETMAYASWPPTYVTCDCGIFKRRLFGNVRNAGLVTDK